MSSGMMRHLQEDEDRVLVGGARSGDVGTVSAANVGGKAPKERARFSAQHFLADLTSSRERQARSSTGRASVSKTEGCRFKSGRAWIGL